jgi:histidinol dehydrogenase
MRISGSANPESIKRVDGGGAGCEKMVVNERRRIIIFVVQPVMLRLVTPESVLDQAHARTAPVDEATLSQASAILSDVEKEGVVGLRRHAARLGDLTSASDGLVADKAELAVAFNSLPKPDQDLLVRTASRIRAFAEAQLKALKPMQVKIPGGKAGHSLAPVNVAGCYAPGGRYPLPSSVLMTAITARVAGVNVVVVASPKPTQVTLAAAHVAGADVLLKCGGAQAIGALAFGCVPGFEAHAADVIVGPGNRWVTAAKQLVGGRCGIDMLAGPSECLVWCDAQSDAGVVAADLLAQSEHDVDAIPILVTHDDGVIARVQAEITKQLETLSTAETASKAVERKGYAVKCASLQQAADVCNHVGPEHLEVMTTNAREDAKLLTQYGGLFIGQRSAEVFGDYGAGPNHVLPTSGTARYTGGLSVFTFLRIRTWMDIDNEKASQELVNDAAALARLEGLEGHARAAERRAKADTRKKSKVAA